MVAQADSSLDRKRSAFHNGPIAEGAADFLSSTVIVLKFLRMERTPESGAGHYRGDTRRPVPCLRVFEGPKFFFGRKVHCPTDGLTSRA
jgi:hypothetical protein